ADKAANSTECCMMLENALDCLSIQLEEKLNLSTSGVEEPCKDQENGNPNVQQMDVLLSGAKLKKKRSSQKIQGGIERGWISYARGGGSVKQLNRLYQQKKEQRNQRRMTMCFH
ncbi:unnamed protein product, partial [Urochloa humidicola]